MKLQRQLPRKMAIFQVIILLLGGLMTGLGAEKDQCMPTWCRKHDPEIRFPFRLKGRQPKHCGYPGFDLSCTRTNRTVLELPFSVKVAVKKIDYISQTIHTYDPDGCLPRQLPNLNLSASPFRFVSKYFFLGNFSIFSCPPTHQKDPNLDYGYPIACLSDPSHEVYAYTSCGSIKFLPLSCKKMYTISSVPNEVFDPINNFSYQVVFDPKNDFPYEGFDPKNDFRLNWNKPMCGKCEADGRYCRLKNNSIQSGIACFGKPRQPTTDGRYCRLKNNSRQSGIDCFGKPRQPTKGALRKLEVAGGVLGPSLLVVVFIAVCLVHRSNKIKKEDQVKIKIFLEDYKALKPARYSYSDIKKITNQFLDKVGQGGYGTVYKGQLSKDVHVAVKILDNVKGNGDDFINEVGIIGKIHHINVVRLVGYCADGFRRALLYEFLPNNSLEKFISSDHEKRSLGWEKLQDIALGIAKGIEYLHLGCEQRILHFDIKPRNILLDHNFNPKISDFGQAKLCSKEESAVSMTAARGTVGYIAPEVFSRNFGSVSYKSDVYSFGMLLLEMVGGKKDTVTENTSQVYFPEWIYNRLDQGDELGIEIGEDGDAKIVRKLTIVGLWCIQWYPVDRPSIKVVVQMLEGDGGTIMVPPSPFAFTNPMTTRGTLGGRPFNSELEVIPES